VADAARVIVVGSVNVDLVVRVPRLPGPGETVSEGSFSRGPGGKGGNAAVAAARLGADTSMVGCVGDDDFGEAAREDLESGGVDCTWLGTSSAPTGVAQIIVDGAGENLIAVASGANRDLGAGFAADAVRGLASQGAVVMANLEIREETVLAAAKAARAAGCRFLLNPAPARELPDELLGLCDVLTPNQHELGLLGRASAEELLAAGAGAVVVTRGGEGAEVRVAGEEPRLQQAFAVDVVDTTGAGDAFSAALAWSLADGQALDEAVRRAAAAGGLATQALGARAALPTCSELDALLARR
jgi:ribokinase